MKQIFFSKFIPHYGTNFLKTKSSKRCKIAEHANLHKTTKEGHRFKQSLFRRLGFKKTSIDKVISPESAKREAKLLFKSPREKTTR